MRAIVFFLFSIVLFSSCTLKPITVTKVGEVKVKDYSMKGATVEIKLTVNNPNAFGLGIYKSDLNVKLNNVDLGSAKIDKKIKIKRKAEKEYDIILSSDFSKLGPAMLISLGQLFVAGKMNNPIITVNGELRAGNLFYKKRFPVEVKQKINLSR